MLINARSFLVNKIRTILWINNKQKTTKQKNLRFSYKIAKYQKYEYIPTDYNTTKILNGHWTILDK